MKKELKKLIVMIMSLALGLAVANFTYAADTSVQETGNGDSHNESVTNEAVEVKAIGLKSAYATGETINIKVRVINKGSESLRLKTSIYTCGKIDTIYAELAGADGIKVIDNYYYMAGIEGCDGYLNVNEYMDKEYVYDMGEATPGAYTLEVSFEYRDDDDKWQRVSNKYDVEIGLTGGTEYEEDEITGSAVFLSDKAGEIKEYTDELSIYPVKYRPVKLYEYPGSKYYTVYGDFGYDYSSLLPSGEFIPTKVYTDENGKVWGYINYRDWKVGEIVYFTKWYCLSSPRDNLTNYLRGDADLNEKVDLDDATLVLKKAVGISIMQDLWSYDWSQVNADVNEDGKVDLKDASTVLRMAVGVSEDF